MAMVALRRPGSKLDDSLEDWNTLRRELGFSGLVIGNGASRAVWEGFAYESLLRVAREENSETRLDDQEARLFTVLGTVNFEAVLSALAVSNAMSRALSVDAPVFQAKHRRIQAALVEAVNGRHVPWNRLQAESLKAIQAHFREYRRVYSTNYDLLAYWAVMHQGVEGFKDYFWDNRFDLANTEIWDSSTVVMYLHGALHLRRSVDGHVFKQVSQGGRNLLEMFADYQEDAFPLFVAEGSSADKLRAIYSSDYLAFVYSQLVRHEGPLCIFGHALGASDQHIVDAIKAARVSEIAISVRREPSAKVVERKAALIQRFPAGDLRFFDSASHPLGAPALLVPQVV